MNYENILHSLGYKLTNQGKFWRTSANYRGGQGAATLAINKKTGVVTDFGTGKNMSFTAFGNINGLNIEQGQFTETLDEVEEAIVVTKHYPKQHLRTLIPDYGFFVTARGISLETMRVFQAGLEQSGKLARRIIFPIYDKLGNIIGFAGRYYHENVFGATPKWKILGRKTSFIYPCHLINPTKESVIVLVESVGDLLALWQRGIRNVYCLFGTSLSGKLMGHLMGLNPAKVVIATNNERDNDSIGNEAGLAIAKKLRGVMEPSKISVRLPARKDFSAMSGEEIDTWAKLAYHQ